MEKKEENLFFIIKVLRKEKVKELKEIYTDASCYCTDEKELNKFDELFPIKKK